MSTLHLLRFGAHAMMPPRPRQVHGEPRETFRWAGSIVFAQGVQDFAGDQPSFFDFNLDGNTDQLDAQIVTQYMNTDCLGICRRSDLNSDGVVNDLDLSILNASLGTTCELCAADLDDNGVVNAADSNILQSNIGCTLPSQGRAVR